MDPRSEASCCAVAMTQAVQWDQGVSDAWSRIAQIGPKILVFALVLTVGAVVVRGALHAADRVLEQAGLDGALDRAGASRLLRCQTGVIRGWLLRVVAVICLLAILRAALGVFGPSPADRMAGTALALLARALLAAVIALLGLALAAWARRLVTESFAGLRHGNALSRAVAGFAVLAFGKAALDELGIGTSVTTPLLYAVLAACTGVVVVGVGGGLVRPMQSRWEKILDRAEDGAGEARAAWHANRGAARWAPPSSAGQSPPGRPSTPPGGTPPPPAPASRDTATPPCGTPMAPLGEPGPDRGVPVPDPGTAVARRTAPQTRPHPGPATEPASVPTPTPVPPRAPAPTPAAAPAPRHPPVPLPGERGTASERRRTPAPSAVPVPPPPPRSAPPSTARPGASSPPGALPRAPSAADVPGRVPSTDPAPASPRTTLPSPSVLPGTPPTSPVRGEDQLPGTVSD
ncbi:conserved hypothetical protein [Parafrankia sp. EAN1pec]|nr:conserved hypothetical protein [Frankia sp. EAN1pec]